MYLYFTLFSKFVTLLLSCFMRWKVGWRLTILLLLFFNLSSKFNFYVFISNFHVILYLNWVLVFFTVRDFILNFRYFMVTPSVQNAFVAPQLGFSSAKFIKGSFGHSGNEYSKTFCTVYCSVLFVLFSLLCNIKF